MGDRTRGNGFQLEVGEAAVHPELWVPLPRRSSGPQRGPCMADGWEQPRVRAEGTLRSPSNQSHSVIRFKMAGEKERNVRFLP